MASVNEYLKKLLYQYDCVVVPELGAFLTHFQSASFSETNSLYLPPRKRVAFNEALRLDDGILANYIMLHEPVTREGAQRHINLFVEELRQQVIQTGRFELEGIGTFTQNDEGKLQFSPSIRHNFFGEAYGMSAVSAQLVNRQPQLEPAIEAVPVTALGPVLVQEDVTIEPLRPSRPYWRVAATALLVGSLGLVSYFSVVKPDQPLQSSLDPTNLFRIPASFFERSTAATAPVKAATIRKAVHVSLPVAEPKPETAPAPATASEPVVVNAPVETPAVEPVSAAPSSALVTKSVRTTPYYTVIAGSFTSKHNALGLKRQLRKAGYTDAFVIMPAEKGQLYKVAAAGSAVREEAVANMAAINALAGTESWIYKN